ncbi:MAG: glycosyltransferase [bacterium]|nr:glycosyltransferase [bacterium]
MISVIATVLNEGEAITRLMESLLAQTVRPDEVVIVDGGSRDRTIYVLRRYENRLPLKLIVAPGCNISQGRNLAIREAHGDLIAVTDAGVSLAPDWLDQITRPLRENRRIHVVSGFFRADPHTIFEAAMGATVLPLEDEIDPVGFLPSSRSVAFRKAAWEAVGGYPEWLDYCEDLVFDLRLRARFGAFAFAPQAVVYFRPRASLPAYFRQYRLYARGDGKADLWRMRHAVRYGTYLAAVPLIYGLGRRVHPLLWGLFVVGAAIYTRKPYRRLKRVLRAAAETNQVRVDLRANALAVALVPVIRLVGDLAKMIGYPVGWLWRVRSHPPNWRKG